MTITLHLKVSKFCMKASAQKKSIFSNNHTNSLTGMAAYMIRPTLVLQTNMEKESTYLDHSYIKNPSTSNSHTDGWSLVEGVYPTIVMHSFLSLLHFLNEMFITIEA